MSEEIEAILRAEDDQEVDVERAIRRLRETNERLQADPADGASATSSRHSMPKRTT